LSRYKGYAFINIFGLAAGMACCILIISYILTELSYDKYHEHSDRIYRVATDVNAGGFIAKLAISNAPLGPALKNSYPEVLQFARIQPRDKQFVVYQNRQFFEEGVIWADNSIFNVFSFPFTKGDPTSALQTAYSVILTEETAKKYFGDTDPLGKALRFNNRNDFTVTGVVENVPTNSHFSFDMLCSLETRYAQNRENMEVWLNFNLYTYLLFPEDYDFKILEQKLPDVVEKYMGNDLKAMGGKINYFLQPLKGIHLHSNLENEISGNSRISYIYIFSAIAIFILLIACINFMNLATARSSIRAKEVGLRKVVGAFKKQLIIQFLGESLLISIIAFIFSLVLVRIALPVFSSLSGRELHLDFLGIPWLIPGLTGFVIFVGLIAGSYPAFFLSSFKPVTVLKGQIRSGRASTRFRSILVVTQFIISITLIIGTSIILKQLDYVKNKNLGFDKGNLIVTELMDTRLRQSQESIKAELKKVPGVINAATSHVVPGQDANVQPFIPQGFSQEQSQLMLSINIDQEFIPTYGIELIEGRNFSHEFTTDANEAVIINETAMRKFGWNNAVGKTIQVPSNKVSEWNLRTIIGVIKDFHFDSLHSIIMPLCLSNEPNYFNTVTIRINPKNISETLGLLQEKWKTIVPGHPFDFFFLDEYFGRKYASDEKLSNIFGAFTLFAIFIACLGLFGMASFMSEQRTKEIGIRKVMGASILGVVTLMSRDFIKLVLVANVIAWPIAYFTMRSWLQNFAYQAGINIWIFVQTAVLAVGIAVITVSYQSIKSAFANPVDTIKYE